MKSIYMVLLIGVGVISACGDDATPAVDGGLAHDASADASAPQDALSDVPHIDPDAGADADSSDSGTGDAGTGDAGQDAGDDTPPTLEIELRDGAHWPSRQLHLVGGATDDVEVTSVSVNDEAATIEDGEFVVDVVLQPGANVLEFVARDGAGNVTTDVRNVYFGHRVSVGNSQAVFLQDGSPRTWGRNELGQLGNGSLQPSRYGDDPEVADFPVAYDVALSGVVSIVTRQTFMIALREDGTVWTWGSNSSGQLGYESPADCGSRGTSLCQRVPTQVSGIEGAVAIAAGFEHSLVLLETGRVLSFGSNEEGQLGRVTAGDFDTSPAEVDGLTDVVQLGAGSDTTFAVTASGALYAFGSNQEGQLGQGDLDDDAHVAPVRVDVPVVAHVAASNRSVLALLVDGTVLGWGHNHRGQVAVGSEDDNILAPTQVINSDGPLTGVALVFGDGFVSGALGADGSVWMWGMGSLGQLGQGALDDGERDLDNRSVASLVPVAAVDRELFDIREAELGAGGPTLALADNGDLYGWGWSFRGSLGLDGAIDAWAYASPVLVLGTE